MTKLAPICPKCGKEAKRIDTKFGTKHSCCGLWSWDGKPLVSASTHNARNVAHAAFDGIWKSGLISRGEAYRLLAAELGLTAEQCHVAHMDADTAGKVPMAVRQIKSKIKSHPISAPVSVTVKRDEQEISMNETDLAPRYDILQADNDILQVGDEVVCISLPNPNRSNLITLGAVYRILEINGEHLIKLEEIGPNYSFIAERFRLFSNQKRQQRRAQQRLDARKKAARAIKEHYSADQDFGSW